MICWFVQKNENPEHELRERLFSGINFEPVTMFLGRLLLKRRIYRERKRGNS
jgi:hypothetical protein